MSHATSNVKTSKNTRDPAEPSDGKRILVMRLWPRGTSKQKLHLDRWLKEVGTEKSLIHKWKSQSISWDEFALAYNESLLDKRELLQVCMG